MKSFISMKLITSVLAEKNATSALFTLDIFFEKYCPLNIRIFFFLLSECFRLFCNSIVNVDKRLEGKFFFLVFFTRYVWIYSKLSLKLGYFPKCSETFIKKSFISVFYGIIKNGLHIIFYPNLNFHFFSTS